MLDVVAVPLGGCTQNVRHDRMNIIHKAAGWYHSFRATCFFLKIAVWLLHLLLTHTKKNETTTKIQWFGPSSQAVKANAQRLSHSNETRLKPIVLQQS